MALTRSGLNAARLQARLQQIGERSHRAALREMRRGAQEMADIAQHFAPRDDGTLEESIQVREERGKGNRVEVIVEINPEAYDEKGARVLSYGAIMENELSPEGPLQPRKKKHARGGFFKYAFRSMAQKVASRVRKAVLGELR